MRLLLRCCHHSRVMLLAALFCSTAASQVAGQVYRFEEIPMLPGDFISNRPTGISADGERIVGVCYSQVIGPVYYLRNSEGEIIVLSDLLGIDLTNHRYDFNISADGQVIVGCIPTRDGEGQAFRWTEAGGIVTLDDGDMHSLATAASADGSCVVGNGPTGACLWQADQEVIALTTRPDEENVISFDTADEVTDISADGTVVVGMASSIISDEYLPHAFRWTQEEGMTVLTSWTDVTASIANAISDDGQVIVGYAAEKDSGRKEACYWTEAEGRVTLESQANIRVSCASAVSADGSIIVGNTVGQESDVFLWREDDGMRSLQEILIEGGAEDVQGWSLTDATGISADGSVITGYGVSPTHQHTAWVAYLW